MFKWTKKTLSLLLAAIMIFGMETMAFASRGEIVDGWGEAEYSTPQFPQGTVILPSDERQFLPNDVPADIDTYEAIDENTEAIREAQWGETISNVRTSTWNLFDPLTEWTYNNYAQNESVWPSVSCSRTAGIIVSASYDSSLTVDAGVVKEAVGFAVSGSSTLTAGQSYTYRIPYGQGGRIIMRYSIPYASFDVKNWFSSGTGDAFGKPTSSYVTLQRIYLWQLLYII